MKNMKTIKIGKRIEIRIYPKKSKYQKLEEDYFYLKHIPDATAARETLNCMKEIINDCGAVSLADAYDLIGLASTYSDNNYGWTNVDKCLILPSSCFGYVLRLPEIKRIK